TRSYGDWSSDVCSSDLLSASPVVLRVRRIGLGSGGARPSGSLGTRQHEPRQCSHGNCGEKSICCHTLPASSETQYPPPAPCQKVDRKGTRLNSSHRTIS